MNKKIGFIGLGKLGLDCAEVFAEHYEVYGYDVVPRESKVVKVCSIEETVNNSEWIFIAVPTPHAEGYDGSVPSSHMTPRDFGHDAVLDAIDKINQYANSSKKVVLISTVLPGTTRHNFITKLDPKHQFLYNPYLIAMGSVKWDMVNPEMVMIGTKDGDRTSLASELIDIYRPMMKNDPRYVVGTWDECEAIKIFYNCYSDDTEVLTSTGWKLFKDATDTDEVLSLNPDTMIPEWLKPTKFVESEYVGDMIHFVSSKDDILVTPTHNMLYGKQRSLKDPGYSCSYEWGIAPASELTSMTSFVFQRSTNWHNDSPLFIEINGITLATADYVQFMAWYLSEGCLSDNRVIVSQDKQKNPEKYEMIRGVMENIYQSHPDKTKRRLLEGQTGFSILWDELADYLRPFGKSFNKFIPVEIKNLGKDMLRLFLDTYNLGDGSSMPEVNFNSEVTFNKRYKYYATSSDQMAADLGELIIKVGRFPSYRTTKTVLSNKPCNLVYELVGRTSGYQKSSSNGLKFHSVRYNGKVYCAILPKNHVFLTRRNGKCTWQGNTFISAKVGLANMIQDFAMRIGNINVDVVTDALANSTMRIMGPKYMTAGLGDSGACVLPNFKVTVDKEIKEIEQLYKEYEADPTVTRLIESATYSCNSRDQKKIDRVTCREYSGDMIKFSFDGVELITTPEHLIPVIRNRERMILRADQILETDKLIRLS
jgi:UDP-glucose 6-dehydrogenase